MDHRNRDYFARPIQSDRLRQDYGNTKLGKTHKTWLYEYSGDFTEAPRRGGTAKAFLFGIAVGAIGFAALMQALPALPA